PRYERGARPAPPVFFAFSICPDLSFSRTMSSAAIPNDPGSAAAFPFSESSPARSTMPSFITSAKPPTFHIAGPADVKALDEKDLPLLAEEIRRVLIMELARTGGHLGPNLGVVELTLALHRVFDT